MMMMVYLLFMDISKLQLYVYRYTIDYIAYEERRLYQFSRCPKVHLSEASVTLNASKTKQCKNSPPCGSVMVRTPPRAVCQSGVRVIASFHNEPADN